MSPGLFQYVMDVYKTISGWTECCGYECEIESYL